MTEQDELKQAAALAALDFIDDDAIVGIGTGSTTNFFIAALAARFKHRIDATVASSQASAERLKSHGLRVLDLNTVPQVDIYVDGADEATEQLQLIKGGGGALTGEKILAKASKRFICLIHNSKLVKRLGQFPVAVEVLPMARSLVAREIVKLGGQPAYREGFVTDHGNLILDVYHLDIMEPMKLETALNEIPGAICNGLFAHQQPDALLVAYKNTVKKLSLEKTTPSSTQDNS